MSHFLLIQKMTATKRKRKAREREDSDTIPRYFQREDDRGIIKKASNSLSLLLFLITMMLLGLCSSIMNIIIVCFEDSKKRSDIAKKREVKQRSSWSKENKHFSDRMFYRLFRMHRPCFNRLCARIEKAVGPKVFKSEKYLENLRNLKSTTPESRMYYAALHTTGEYISGEIKVCLALRYLAGGSYLDLFLW